MSSREALAAALEKWYWLAANGTTEMALRYLAENDPQVGIELSEAARERLAQLPEKCPRLCSDGCGEPCNLCHGKGFLYPSALVERIARGLHAAGISEAGGDITVPEESLIVAVLDALNDWKPE